MVLRNLPLKLEMGNEDQMLLFLSMIQGEEKVVGFASWGIVGKQREGEGRPLSFFILHFDTN